MNRKLPVDVDSYLIDGCGRCERGGTPRCSVNKWQAELKELRQIALDSGLVETVKWSVPCYTYENKNIMLVSALLDYCAISFFKGALFNDRHHILVKPGENSQSRAAGSIHFGATSCSARIGAQEYIAQAIEVEKSGAKVEFKAKSELVIPEELQRKFEQLPKLQTAFKALTPGRQRGYILHISAAKQSKTREARIEKCTPMILEGKGMHD